jgi:type II secretory pathway component PulF
LGFLPGIGGFLWKRDLLLSFQFLALLLRSGLPMAEALKTLVRSTHNRELQSAFASVLKRLAVGQDVSMSFFEESFRFRKDGEEIANIVEIGDKTATLMAC